MTSNLLSVHFISAIRADTEQPVIYFNFTPHDPCVYDWLKEVCPAIRITSAAAALVDSQILSREQMKDAVAQATRAVSFDAHFMPDDPTGVQLLTMLILGNHITSHGLSAFRVGSSYIKAWFHDNDLHELLVAQYELLTGDKA